MQGQSYTVIQLNCLYVEKIAFAFDLAALMRMAAFVTGAAVSVKLW